jgi:hypothetical protein
MARRAVTVSGSADRLERDVRELKQEIKRMKMARRFPLKPAPVRSSPPPAPPEQAKQFPPSVRKGTRDYDVPDGIIAHLTKECGGNVHGRLLADVTSGSFEKETEGAIPH